MTQVFGYFSAPTAPLQFPGAAFLSAGAAHRRLCRAVHAGAAAGRRRTPPRSCPPRRPGRDARASAAPLAWALLAVAAGSPLSGRARHGAAARSATCSCWCSRISPTRARFGPRLAGAVSGPRAAGAGRAAPAVLRHRPCESAQLRGDGERPGAERADAARLSCLRGLQCRRAARARCARAAARSRLRLPAAVRTLPDQLEAAGLHLESLHGGHGQRPGARAGHLRPRAGRAARAHARGAQLGDQYAAKHDPFVYFHSIIDDRARCEAHVVNLSAPARGSRQRRHHCPTSSSSRRTSATTVTIRSASTAAPAAWWPSTRFLRQVGAAHRAIRRRFAPTVCSS